MGILDSEQLLVAQAVWCWWTTKLSLAFVLPRGIVRVRSITLQQFLCRIKNQGWFTVFMSSKHCSQLKMWSARIYLEDRNGSWICFLEAWNVRHAVLSLFSLSNKVVGQESIFSVSFWSAVHETLITTYACIYEVFLPLNCCLLASLLLHTTLVLKMIRHYILIHFLNCWFVEITTVLDWLVLHTAVLTQTFDHPRDFGFHLVKKGDVWGKKSGKSGIEFKLL